MTERDDWQVFADDLRSGRAERVKKLLGSKKERERLLSSAQKVHMVCLAEDLETRITPRLSGCSVPLLPSFLRIPPCCLSHCTCLHPYTTSSPVALSNLITAGYYTRPRSARQRDMPSHSARRLSPHWRADRSCRRRWEEPPACAHRLILEAHPHARAVCAAERSDERSLKMLLDAGHSAADPRVLASFASSFCSGASPHWSCCVRQCLLTHSSDV